MQQTFLLQILLLAQHVSVTTMPIIRSSRVLYSVCCLWYFVLWFSSSWSGVELRVMCPVCRMLHGQNHIKFEKDCVYCAVRNASLNIIQIILSLQAVLTCPKIILPFLHPGAYLFLGRLGSCLGR